MIITRPENGTLRIKKRFAWFPRHTYDLKYTERLWLQFYYVVTRYSSYFEKHGYFDEEEFSTYEAAEVFVRLKENVG